MKTPLVFKLILLLVLAWRLILSNKKTKKPQDISYIDLFGLPTVELQKPSLHLEPKEAIKRFYRDAVRVNPEASQGYFICFLAEKLQKHYAKRGIFRLFWYDQQLVVAFYQSLQILNMSEEQVLFEKILTKLSPAGLTKISNKETLEPNSFIDTNQEFDPLYIDFDKVFDINKYCQALVNLFYAN